MFGEIKMFTKLVKQQIYVTTFCAFVIIYQPIAFCRYK